MAFERYGLTTAPGEDAARPLQYVVSESGGWSMNCFACHGGEVLGEAYPGAPNRRFALELLTADVRLTKLGMRKSMSHMDLGSLFMPLGTTRGTTNAVMFGVALLANRDSDLNLLPTRIPPSMTHHDMDAPPWWHFRKKQHLYIDGFAPKATRPLMQFMLVEQNGPDQFAAWERDFEHIYAYLSSLEPPPYPFPVDAALAQRGEAVFDANCAECHGTYGGHSTYPERSIPWEEIGTDPVRLRALTAPQRQHYASSWFAEGHRAAVVTDPDGYVAPPLDGLWASAPYFHNGSVPTVWHVLHPDSRPVVWRRNTGDYDQTRVGLSVDSFAALPPSATSKSERIEFFDTGRFGKGNAGHRYPDRLTPDEKQAVLEYLKTL